MTAFNQWIALGLAVTTLGVLPACSTSNKLATDNERAIGAESQIGTRYFEADSGESAVREEGAANDLDNLAKNRELSYYTGEFERLGYGIYDMKWGEDEVTFLVRRGDGIKRVRLTLNDNTEEGRANAANPDIVKGWMRRARDVQIDSIRSSDIEAARQAPEFERLATQIRETLQPGQAPLNYLGQLRQFGDVSEYQLVPDTSQARYILEANGQTYEILMDIKQETEKVSSIQVNPDIWGINKQEG